MIWLIGICCFAVGLCVGALLFKQFMSDAAKVSHLEETLVGLQSEYDHYKNNVHSHFSGTAQLMDNLTESYRDVYRHLATGAHSLCPESISNQLSLSAQSPDFLPTNNPNTIAAGTTEPFNPPGYLDQKPNNDTFASPLDSPPRDYADKSSPDQKGPLAEDYGLEKIPSDEDEQPDKIG